MSNADAVIAALRSGFDDLAGRVSGLTDQQLTGPTGADEWDVSQVLSHLGSGAEIAQNTLQVSLEGKPNPGLEFNKPIWARYDAASPRERLEWFLASNEALTQSFESLSEETRQSLKIDMGFLPFPIDVATGGGYRLNELALHSWDVRVGFDPAATVAPEATPNLLGLAANLAGFLGKPDALDGTTAVIAVTTTDPGQSFTLALGEKVSVIAGAPDQSDGALTLPAEAWLRLLTGRLKPQYTPEGISATGAASLDLLRRVFPKF
ncbi:MAG TPA: maleylpyruvate isomerase family mycothiol-dependent enzyme [Trebonia sp.]|nr:maleylpyruvate isomerase family mycothiol-dependent enzyme [Trebonia sp.]